LFELITRGEIGVAMVCGGGALATQKAAERAGRACPTSAAWATTTPRTQSRK